MEVTTVCLMTCRKPGSANARPSGEAPGLVVSSRRARCHAVKTGGVQSNRDRVTHHHLGSSPGDGQIAATPPTGVTEGKAQPVKLSPGPGVSISQTAPPIQKPLFGRYLLTHRRPCQPGHRVNETYFPRPHTHTEMYTDTHRSTNTHRHTDIHIRTWTHTYTETQIYRYMHTDAHVNTHRPRCIYHSVQFSHSVMSDSLPMDCSTPAFPVHHQLPELAQTHVH